MVKRYRLSYRNGVIEDDGSPRDCQDSMPMVLASDYDTLKQCYDGVVNAGNKLIAERDALLADAQRYRWLRNTEGSHLPIDFKPPRTLGGHRLSYDDLDAAIDAASKEGS